MKQRKLSHREVDREIAADRLLSSPRDIGLVRNRFKIEEVFEPFAVARYQPLSGPAPSRSFCAECRGPKRWGSELCRVCEQKRSLQEFERVIEYWLGLWRGYVGDFTPELIDRIHQHEKRLGPAAFWPREESVV